MWYKRRMAAPYRIEGFGEVVIPSDWLFYTPLARHLRRASNEEAMADLCQLISRIKRTRWERYYGILGGPEMSNMAGLVRQMKGTNR